MNIRDREILRLAVPSIVTNVTVPLLGLVDLAIVGHIGNETMIGAIAVGSMIFNVMYWLMGFLRMGTSGMTAQAYGHALAADEESLTTDNSPLSSINSSLSKCDSPLSAILRNSLRMALFIAIGFVLLQLPLRWLALWLMGPSAEVASLVRVYFNICIWGAPAVLSLYVMTGWFIGMQDTRTPMVVSISQNIINIVASLVLVFGFKMQIEGVALGTLIAQWSGALMAIFAIRKKYRPSFSAGKVREDEQTTFSLFKTNRDLFLRTLCLVSVNLFFTSAGARQGDLLLSVNTLLMTFFTLFSYIMDGFANAGEALCGKYYGAEGENAKGDSFQSVCNRLFRWGWLMVLLFTAVYALGGRSFLGLLTDEAKVVEAAMTYLPWALLIPLSGMAAFVYDGIFIGIMDTRGMLVSCAIATTAFFVIYFCLFPVWGNHALWLALIIYLALRGLMQCLWMRKTI
ncbi:MAG: MATE family efflux transporter [Prevotella sp.]|nr:MATE family efflux transporter [Prevotella sp.]